MVDVEGTRDALRKELENFQQKMTSMEEECRKMTVDKQMALEEQERLREQAAEQQRSVESDLDTVNSQLADMRVELEAAHGRVEALETQLSQTEESRHEVEVKLSSIISTLRRTVGISTGDRTRSRSSSPRKGLRLYYHYYSVVGTVSLISVANIFISGTAVPLTLKTISGPASFR